MLWRRCSSEEEHSFAGHLSWDGRSRVQIPASSSIAVGSFYSLATNQRYRFRAREFTTLLPAFSPLKAVPLFIRVDNSRLHTHRPIVFFSEYDFCDLHVFPPPAKMRSHSKIDKQVLQKNRFATAQVP